MPRFIKDDLKIETAVPREMAELRRDGFVEQKARTKAVREADAARTAGPDTDAAKAGTGTAEKADKPKSQSATQK